MSKDDILRKIYLDELDELSKFILPVHGSLDWFGPRSDKLDGEEKIVQTFKDNRFPDATITVEESGKHSNEWHRGPDKIFNRTTYVIRYANGKTVDQYSRATALINGENIHKKMVAKILKEMNNEMEEAVGDLFGRF